MCDIQNEDMMECGVHDGHECDCPVIHNIEDVPAEAIEELTNGRGTDEEEAAEGE